MSEDEETVEFIFDGKPITAKQGQTIAGALHGSGKRIFSRSFKYHRPRGLFCVSGKCPNCLCNVDGEPSVRICTREVQDGADVRSQNRWPSLNFDLLSIFDKLHRFMPVGFYYKMMHKPRWLWPIAEKFIRNIAGLGRINLEQGHLGEYDKQNLFTDVAVVGGGWAGLHAAIEAASFGVTVILIDDQPELGGHLRYDPLHTEEGLGELIDAVYKHPKIEVINRAVVFGCYYDGYLGIQQNKRLIRLRAEQIIIATGGWERAFVFENNDLPGNMLASGAQRLLHLDGCQLEGRAVVVTDNPQGYRVALQLQKTGTNVVSIVELNSTASSNAENIEVICGHVVRSASGKKKVTGAQLETIDGKPGKTIACDWIIQAVGFHPDVALLAQSGCKVRYNECVDHPLVEKYAKGISSAGSVNGHHDLDDCEVER